MSTPAQTTIDVTCSRCQGQRCVLFEPVPFGYCLCRCGGRTRITLKTDRDGQIKGQPNRFISGHNARLRQHRQLGEWFWGRVDRTSTPNGCWEFTGARNRKGYGKISVGGRDRLAHHIALELAGRVVPDGLQVNHLCNNPPCVRIDHLVFGTSLDDADDKVLSGRQARGEHHGNAKLTEARVLEIRRLYVVGGISKRALGRRFGVGPMTIIDILSGKTWMNASTASPDLPGAAQTPEEGS